jgi:hypothetical protein
VTQLTNAEAMDELVKRIQTTEGFPTVCELFDDDIVVVKDKMFPGRTWNGRAEVEGLWKEIDEGFSDVELPVHETIREDDKIMLFGHFTGLFTGDQYGVSGHARPIRWEFRDAYYFRDGKIVKIDWTNDTLTVAVMTGMLETDPRPTS